MIPTLILFDSQLHRIPLDVACDLLLRQLPNPMQLDPHLHLLPLLFPGIFCDSQVYFLIIWKLLFFLQIFLWSHRGDLLLQRLNSGKEVVQIRLPMDLCEEKLQFL